MNGRFLKRGKIKKPPEMQSSDLRLDSLFYGPEDLYVGAIVEFNKHTFLLTSADDYVFAYMERPSEIEMVNRSSKFHFFPIIKPIFPPFQFPQSNLRIIIDEVINCVQEKGGIKSLMAEFLNRDPDDNGYIMESYFR